MVIFSVILMVVVLFFKNGLMGNREFSWERIISFFRKIFKREKGGGESGK